MLTSADIRKVNKAHRQADDSELWPICGRFSVAERAIRQAGNLRRQGLECYDAQEYSALLDQLESTIVNDPKNL